MNDIERISILLNEAGIEHSGYTLQAPRLEALIEREANSRRLLMQKLAKANEEIAYLRTVIAGAAAIIEAGAALMTPEQLAAWEGHGAVLAVANSMGLGEYHIRALDVAARHMEEVTQP